MSVKSISNENLKSIICEIRKINAECARGQISWSERIRRTNIIVPMIGNLEKKPGMIKKSKNNK